MRINITRVDPMRKYRNRGVKVAAAQRKRSKKRGSKK
jgi:hypothetical protein